MKEEDEEEEDDDDLQSGGSRDDLNELLGDDGLSGAVEGEGQLVNHLGCEGEGGGKTRQSSNGKHFITGSV